VTTEEFRRNSDNYCYRHPDRQSFVLCQRCLRTICPECQTQAAVGVICPECLAEQRRDASPAQRTAERRWGASGRRRGAATAVVRDTRPLMTYGLIAVTVVAYLIEWATGGANGVFAQLFAFNSVYVHPAGPFQPWRLLSVLLVHASILHIGLNMLALWMIGRSLEPLVGRWRFLWLYLIAGLGGSVAVALIAPGTWVVGASGAIFGLFGALLVIGRHIGADVAGIAVVIAINFAFPFVISLVTGGGGATQISWQAHVGGLIAGAAVGFVYARTRRVDQRRLQTILLVITTIVLLALLVIPAVFYR
jgi:membrane associated rhomboid family serine protease